jgi:hypothetical protein
MRFLILNTDYPAFVDFLYREQPELHQKPYAEQLQRRNESLFGVADFYSSNLRSLGHDAYDIHANNPSLQGAWAREHGLRVAIQASPCNPWREAFQRVTQLLDHNVVNALDIVEAFKVS